MGDDFDYWPKVSPDEKKKEDVVENVQLDDLILETIYCWSWIVLVCGSLQR